jgi:ribosomal protein S18 acetylase RimI-like enzyme
MSRARGAVGDPPRAGGLVRDADPPLRVDALAPAHRARLGQILAATGVFRDDEVEVALELFDETGDDYAFLGAFTAGGGLAGYACYGPTPAADRTFDLYWIAVDPAAQGAGAGTAMLDEVERRLRAQSARLLVVETSSRADYAATRRFYERRGYREAARVRAFYAPADDRIVYTKRLDRGRDPVRADDLHSLAEGECRRDE